MIGRVVMCNIGYVELAMQAERRMRKGEHQHQCGGCLRWYWPLHPEEHSSEFGHEPQPTGLEDARRRRKKCPTCLLVEADRERLTAASDALVARTFARLKSASALPEATER